MGVRSQPPSPIIVDLEITIFFLELGTIFCPPPPPTHFAYCVPYPKCLRSMFL